MRRRRSQRGDLNQKIDYHAVDEVGVLAHAFRAVIDAVNALSQDATMLAAAAVDGKFATRADVTKHQGDYRRVVEGFNGTLDVVVDKVNWYQSILDAVSAPIHVIDKDMNWVFLNKAFEKLMVDNGVIDSGPRRQVCLARRQGRVSARRKTAALCSWARASARHTSIGRSRTASRSPRS